MSTRILLTALSGMAFALALVIVGCSSDDGTDPKDDSITDRIADEVVEETYAAIQSEPMPSAFAVENGETAEVVIDDGAVGGDGTTVFDMIVKDNLVYFLTEDGLVMHNLSSGANMPVATETTISAIADLGEKIVVGGDNLYTLDGDMLSDRDYQLNLSGAITVMYRRGPNLIIGTTAGLYELGVNGIRELAADIYVSAIADDELGLWIGTAGQGLYRWDGESFRRRYLRRDTTLFDHVTALAYNHNHLYLGTDRGFYVHDGGRWQPYDLADGLPSETITAINAEDWVIKIGTTRGAVTFFNNEFKPISQMTGIAVNRFITRGNKLLAATAQAGLVMKSGGVFTVLYDGQNQTAEVAQGESW